MSGVRMITVAKAEDGMRLDRWFKARFPGLTQGRLEKLLRTGQVRVEGGRVKGNTRLEKGQTIRIPPLPDDAKDSASKPAADKTARPEDERFIQSLVLYKDDDLIALNKPHGLAVQGGAKTERHVDGMLDFLRFGAEERPRLVHRLDRDTSGVLVVARSRAAAQWLTAAFKAKDTDKLYWALLAGVPHPLMGTIDLALKKAPGHGPGQEGEKMHAAQKDDAEAKDARTHFAVIEHTGRKAAWAALKPETGRTHQLRAHCAAIGTPIVGDGKYGGERAKLGGVPKKLHLHARALSLTTPQGKRLHLHAPLPDHMRRTWETFGFDPDYAVDPFEEAMP